MVREKKPALKGQTSILSFTKGKNLKPALVEDEVESSGEDDSRPAVSSKNASPETSDLPPIHDIAAIFSDIVARTPEIKSVAKHLQGRSLRVATMCSGTESPLLALEMIRRSIEAQYGVNLGVEHVFSCEIEPFKQAYIERNFRPPILFRDVCELDRQTATTAYGAEVPVPGNVDMLVAGTSCVDYSNLNNEKQDISANGESGRTFRGMMGWVKNHQPAIVLLENVCSAPWDKIVTEFERIGYSARNTRFDTKNYYIPHTRTRGYLIAVNEKKSKIPNKWLELVGKMKRPASSTLDAFLLPSDDPRISQAREKLVRESFNAGDRRTGRTDWNRCESRHKRARVEEELGNKRPFTSWDESGFCKMPDFAWADWAQGQVERVWDLMDISMLRAAVKGADPSFKTQVWNLSQNVDRSTGTNKIGICPCLTPSMIPYITNRGGPMVGLEALSLQGLPIDELLLTRETEDNLADLAGNAMSSTVVGTCMMAALILGKDMLDVDNAKVGDKDAMDVDKLASSKAEDVSSHVQGEKQLVKKPLDLSTTSDCSLSELLALAERSARLCECEGRRGVTTRVIRRCVDCGSTSCEKCGGRPEHNTQELLFGTDVPSRVHPSEFEKFFTSTFPMCLDLSGVKKPQLDKLWENLSVEDDEADFWPKWRDAVVKAASSEFRFVELKRQEVWSAVYRSPMGSLELALHPKQPEWRLFARAKDSEPANSELRTVLESTAVARLICKRDASGVKKPGAGLLEGQWEFALPHRTDLKLTIAGVVNDDEETKPSLVPSWESKLGLQAEEFKDRRVYSQLRISIDEASETSVLERDIAGLYTLFDRCGTANSGLHKKESTKDEADLPPLYFFLDPFRCADPNKDRYVFSISKSRYEFGEIRPITCALDPKWRQITAVDGKSPTIDAHVSSVWSVSQGVTLQPSHEENATFSVPSANFTIDASLAGCEHASAVLVCRVPLEDQAGPEWPRGSWVEVDKTHERATYKAISWLIERVRNVEGHFTNWQQVESHVESTAQDRCERCAPISPNLTWVKNSKNKIVALEDSIQAGEYERRLKGRPAPFVTQLKFDESHGIGTLRIAINIPSLLHRALSRLPNIEGNGRIQKAPTLSWRLNTEFSPAAQIHLPKFTLLSNKKDKEHKQPPHFKLPLRVEQLRSLEWMIKQESSEVEPFTEEEISEAIITSLGWRAEGRVQREVFVRGGVLADQVGYGKTAITLALVDCTQKSIGKEVAKRDEIYGKVITKATLIIVPPHLTRQWGSEVKKFTGASAFKTVVVSTMSDWNRQTIETITEADVVIIASNLLKSEAYLDSLSALSTAGDLPKTAGRYMETCLDKIGEGLKKQVERLRTKGAGAVLKEIETGRRREQEAAQAVFIQKKRLKGKNYREAAEKEETLEEVTKPLSTLKVSDPGKPPKKSIKELQDNFIGVIIDKPKSRASSEPETTSPRSSSPAQGDDSDSGPRKRKAAAKRKLVISDESDEEPAPSKRSAAAKHAKRPLKRARKSDDDNFTADSDADEDSDVHMSDVADSEDDVASEDSEEDPAPKKSKAKAKAPAAKFKPPKKSASKAKSSKPSSSAATSEDAMSVDEGAPIKKSKKRKTDNDVEKPKKKLREDFDPWKLKASEVRKDWEQLRAPPLEIFHWARKVIDEYTYLEDAPQLPLIARLTADRHWVLSGTPPIHDFSALKTIAAFMNVHLGVDDDGEGKSDRVKKRLREQTSAEKFHSFREVHTLEWHAHRHALGQVFLDRFVRQNVAEIDEIPCSENIKKIVLPAAERAIYLELEHHLRALDMTIKRSKKTESDREKRLAQSLGESKTAEEALLKRCSHFDLDQKDKENAMKACEVIVKERKKQLEECRTDLKTKLQKALATEKKTPKTSEESLFREFIRHTYQEGLGDEEASKLVLELFEEAGITLKGGSKAQEKSSAAKGKKSGSDPHLTNDDKAKVWAHREETHEIRKVVKELVGRVRSLRYFTVVRDLQKQKDKPPELPCPSCGRDKVPIDELAVLSSCGHTGCETCVMAAAEKEECVYAGSGKCSAAARVLNVVKGETLGVDDEVRDGRGKHFGLKLEKVVELIKKEIPADERILIFVQFQDLMKKVGAALKAHKINYLEIEGSSASRSKTLQAYQDGDDARVLLLNVMDESASGANLTVANHAIFLSPLLAPSQEIYDACEIQAIGRLRRYGQTKHVYIWRFLSTNTIDVEIYEQRAKRKVE